MQQPKHLKAELSTYTNDKRVVVTSFVILLHIVVVWALAAGLKWVPSVIPDPGDIEVVKIKPQPGDVPSPRPIDFVKPEPLDFPPVDVPTNFTDAPTNFSGPTDNTKAIQPTAPRSIGKHSQPPYPELSRRLGEEGAVLLKIALDPSGAVSTVIVQQSSGFERLDQAAAAWVQSNWRYQPATRDGKPIAAMTLAKIVFNLSNKN